MPAAKPAVNVLGPAAPQAPRRHVSLGLSLMIGTAGLPHILMRFYTVPDPAQARKSAFYATGLIAFFYLLTFILGFGAMVLVGQKEIVAVDKAYNMAAPMLAGVLGGEPMLGFIAAVAFATILAVVAGLTLSGARARSRTTYGSTWCATARLPEHEQLTVARYASLAFGVAAVGLGIGVREHERGLHGGSGVRGGGEREFPGVVPVDLLAAA